MYNFFEGMQTEPKGWLLQQLEIQANGLSGNLDKIWPDIKNSSWIGGENEGWERVPYWLDGFIPLAYLLKNQDMIMRANRYIDAIVERQEEDGWICPCSKDERTHYDVWAHFLLGKVLALYCDYTGSQKVEEALYRSMACLYNLLKDGEIKLFEWGKYRWFECMIPLQFLYEKYNEQWIVELGKIVREQGVNYFDFIEIWKKPVEQWNMETHIVNLCMMFKYEAVCCKLFGEKYLNKAEELWNILENYHGTAVGTFTGDECLAGRGNNQGTELCSVTELMYSCELLYAITGDSIWAERLEKVAYNAFPATLSDDMWTHQYDQQVNQIACIKFKSKPLFTTNNEEAHLFGLEPHFGCCTANHNQGWPKLVGNIFLQTDKGILCSLMLPAELKTQINGTNVTLSQNTSYPFRHSCEYVIQTDGKVFFELKIRIPSWAKSVKVNGKKYGVSEYVVIEKEWKEQEVVLVELSDVPHLVNRPFNMKTVEYGPLVFALPIETEYKMYEYEKDGVERKYPYCDYELLPKSEWRYGYAEDKFEVVESDGDGIPFSSKNPRIKLRTKLSPVEWDFAEGYDNVSNNIPVSNKAIGISEEKELVPYGSAKLRVTEMCMTE